MPAAQPTPTADLLHDFSALRRRAMQSLFETLEQTCEGTLVVDRAARIVQINEAYARRFGTDATSAIGREVEEIIPGSLMRQVVTSGKPILLDVLDAGGHSYLVMRFPVKDAAGETIGAIGLALINEKAPIQPLLNRLNRLREELAQSNKLLAEARRAKYTFTNLVGNSDAINEVKRLGRRAAQMDANVLLLGETGTGKELLAHAIHAASPRVDRPFVSVNVAAIPDTLLEAEFFGTAPGAFTGADRRPRPGKFELADGGTLFLDEIGDMAPGLQAKLLRVLQDSEFEAVGSNTVRHANVRIIAATSSDLETAVANGRFRADLYYRLKVLSISLPPLRSRLQDLPALCEHLLEQIARRTGESIREIEPDALTLLAGSALKGNIRELRNLLEQAWLHGDGPRIGAREIVRALGERDAVAPKVTPVTPREEDLGTSVTPPPSRTADLAGNSTVRPLAEILAEAEGTAVRAALAACGGKVAEAARQLGIGRATLYKRLQALGISSQ